MTGTCMHRNIINPMDKEKPARIREKYREVFGSEITMRDDALLRRYTLTLDGDLVLILK